MPVSFQYSVGTVRLTTPGVKTRSQVHVGWDLVFPFSSGFPPETEPCYRLVEGAQRKEQDLFFGPSGSADVPCARLQFCDVESLVSRKHPLF